MGRVTTPGQEGMAQLLDDMLRRIRKLENTQSWSIGTFRITQNDKGQLVAVSTVTGQTVVLAEVAPSNIPLVPLVPADPGSSDPSEPDDPNLLPPVLDVYSPFDPSNSAAGFALGNGSLVGSSWRVGGLVHVAVKLLVGSTTVVGSGAWSFGGHPPSEGGEFADSRAVGEWFYVRASSTVRASGPVILGSDDRFVLLVGGGSPSLASVSLVTGSNPGPWTIGDVLTFTATYPTSLS